MSPFLWQGQNLCGLSLVFDKDWRVVQAFQILWDIVLQGGHESSKEWMTLSLSPAANISCAISSSVLQGFTIVAEILFVRSFRFQTELNMITDIVQFDGKTMERSKFLKIEKRM